MQWASLQPAVPAYLWKEDPLWAEVPKRIAQADVYMQRLQNCTADNDEQAAELEALKEFVAAQKATLVLMQQAQFAKAEVEQARVRQLETQLAEMLSLFSWPKAERRPVYNRATRVSRYDSFDESRGTVQVFCAFRGCKKPQILEFSRTNSWYMPSCVSCGRTCWVYIARLLELQATKKRGQTRYTLRLEDAQHKNVRVEFADGSGDVWQVVERDYLALLYTWHTQGSAQAKTDAKLNAELSAVVNLTRKHVFWISKVGDCFVATAFLGESALELHLFRRFRDEVLLPNFWGRLWVRGYYAIGPFAARFLSTQPWLRAPMRRWLRRIHHLLQKKMG